MAEDKNPFLGKSKDELDSLIKSGKYAGKEALQLAEAWREVLNIIEDTTIATEDLTSKMAELLKINEKEGKLNKERLAIFTRTVDAFSPLNTKAGNLYNIYNNLKDPVTAVYQMIELSAKRFVELDNAAESFRKTTGFLASQTSVVEATISRTSRDLAAFGVTAENAGVAAQKIAESFSSTALVTDEIVGHVALMEQNLGVAVEDSTSVMQNFMGIGKMSADVANKTAGAAASLAKAAGVPFAKVMKDVATAGGEVLKLVRGSVDALVKGAIEARRLGLELKDVGAAADKFLDFQTSINSEMEASVLFGKDINFTRARELAYAGDLAGLAKEQSRILKEVGDLRKLDAFQTKALAESMGLSVDQLVKMNAKQEEMNELRRKNPDLAAQYEKDLDVLDKTNESLEEKYKKEIRSRQIASQQTKILNDINQIIAKLAELFLPVVSVVMGILVGLIKVSSILITGIMSPITYLYDAFRYVTTEVFDLNKFLSETSNTMSGISAKIGEWVKAITAIGVTLAVVFGREKLRTMILNGIAGPFKIALGFIGKYKEKLKDVAGNVASKIAGGAGSVIPTPTTGAGGVTGGGTSKFVEGVKAIDPKMLLSLGVAMVAFAGSVLILAHAAKVFGSPEAQAGFSSMAIAAIGLAVITAALVGLSTLITTASPIIVPAIGIMLGFAAAVGVLSLAAMGFGKAFQMFVEGFERAIEIDLFSLAAGFYLLSGAIAAFGASMAIGGMASFLGGGMMLQLVALAAISPGLILASDALSSIGTTLQMFKDETIVEGIENITEAVKGLNKEINNVSLLNIAGLSTIGTIGKNAAGGGDEVVSKLDELIELMKSGGIAVNIDGSKVSTAVGVATKFRGSF